MAKARPDVPPAIKQALIRDAGMKCANPGCVNYRTHLHHIQEWAVYQSHDPAHMIAVCPTCHDAIHHGILPIDDATVYRWKNYLRPPTNRDHLYVEPGKPVGVRLGHIEYQSAHDDVTIFDLSSHNRLSYHVHHGDTMGLYVTITAPDGRTTLQIIEGHVRYEAEPPLRYERIPGHIRITAPLESDYVPAWVGKRMRARTAGFARDGQVRLLDLEVIGPGLVQAQGLWIEDDKAIVATRHCLYFGRRTDSGLAGIRGTIWGRTVMRYVGTINQSLFQM